MGKKPGIEVCQEARPPRLFGEGLTVDSGEGRK
jgi:hypothetical protein